MCTKNFLKIFILVKQKQNDDNKKRSINNILIYRIQLIKHLTFLGEKFDCSEFFFFELKKAVAMQ